MAVITSLLILGSLGSAAIIVVGLIMLVTVVVLRSGSGSPAGGELRRARRTSSGIIAAAVAVTIVAVPVLLWGTSSLETSSATGELSILILLLLTPLVLASFYALVSLIGEFAWHRQARPAGLASPAGRASDAVLPRRVLVATGASAVALVVAVVVGSLIAADSQFVITSASGETFVSSSLMVGWLYGVPTLVGLALVGVLTATALYRIVNRSAVHGLSPQDDDDLRTRNAGAVLRGVGSLIVVSLVSVLTVTGLQIWKLARTIDGAQAWERSGQLILILAAAVLAGWGVAAFSPARVEPVPATIDELV